MEDNREELYRMEIRVVLELPEDKYVEYDQLKRRRKLTQRVQKAVEEYEVVGEVKEESARLDRLEESIDKMYGMIGSLREAKVASVGEEVKRVNEEVVVDSGMDKLVSSLDSMSDNFQKLFNKIDKLVEGPGNTVGVKSVEELGGAGGLSQFTKAEISEYLEEIGQKEEKQVERVRKAPTKDMGNKLKSMMDI